MFFYEFYVVTNLSSPNIDLLPTHDSGAHITKKMNIVEKYSLTESYQVYTVHVSLMFGTHPQESSRHELHRIDIVQ